MKRPRDLFGHPIRPPREDAIHAAIVEFLTIAGHSRLLYFHPANGSLVSPSARMYFARLGVYPGVPDLCFVLPDKTVAFMEIKREGGRLNEAQQAFQARCALLGLKYSICRSINDAEEVLSSWGALRTAELLRDDPVMEKRSTA
jgi:hypothetical protein